MSGSHADSTAEERIRREYYDAGWYYTNHSGYDRERDEAAFARYRLKRLEEMGISQPPPATCLISADAEVWENGTLSVKFYRDGSQPLAPSGVFAAAIGAWKSKLGIETGIKDAETGCWVVRHTRPINGKEAFRLCSEAFAEWGVQFHGGSLRERMGEMDWPEWRLS